MAKPRKASPPRHIHVVDNFFTGAKTLRREFDHAFRDPRISDPRRFMWDYWYIPEQYRLHRTRAADFFNEKTFETLKNRLVRYGQDVLGCHSISDPWISFYVDGDSQSLHTDNPHGPWAYVFSLTEWSQRIFTGGETQVLRPEVLSYWQNFNRSRGQELFDFFDFIEPKFNRLTIFDPRLPHGVKEVRGAFDPKEARIVIHGWFVNPEPFVTGGLQNTDITETLNNNLSLAFADLRIPDNIHGIASFAINIDTKGHVRSTQILTSNLVDDAGKNPSALVLRFLNQFKKMKFPKARSASRLVLPLIFD